MEKYLTWNKGIFDSNYQIFESGQIKYTMIFDTWRTEAKTLTQQKLYHFKDDGFLSPTTNIFSENHELIGTITYDVWKTKAFVNLNNGEKFTCDFVNIWHSKWIATNFSNKKITYDSSTSSGSVISDTDDELMLLLGFYVREHFTKIFILLILTVLFIPIFTRGF